jgi:hypothetical protein
MMLRNIPNKYTQSTLMQEINDNGFEETYDFFYLPMDIHNRSNVGYCFINFLRADDAVKFKQFFEDHRFQRFHSRKIGSVCVAHVQGLDANLRHFENRAVTQARNDQYRPVVLRGQRRVDFDEAVTNVSSAGSASGKEELSVKETQQDRSKQQVPPTLVPQKMVLEDLQRRRQKNAASAVKKEAPSNQEPAVAMQTQEGATPGLFQNARDGLEAAIRELLVIETNVAPAPAPAPAPAGVKEIASPAAPPGLEAAHAAPDDEQLWSLRNLLVDKLAEQGSLKISSVNGEPGPFYRKVSPALSSVSTEYVEGVEDGYQCV